MKELQNLTAKMKETAQNLLDSLSYNIFGETEEKKNSYFECIVRVEEQSYNPEENPIEEKIARDNNGNNLGISLSAVAGEGTETLSIMTAIVLTVISAAYAIWLWCNRTKCGVN